jgi:fatty-acid desaturase
MTSLAWVLGGLELTYVLENFDSQWHWIVISLCYAIVVNELFFHIILGHLLFRIDPERPMYKLLVFLATTSLTYGTISGMALLHDSHHRHADQDEHDYLSSSKRWITSGLLSPLMFVYQPYKFSIPDYDNFVTKQTQRYRYLLDNQFTKFCNEYQLELTLCWWLCLFLILPVLFFKLILMSRLLMSIFSIINTLSGHNKLLLGYRNFNTTDHSYNNLIVHYAFLGLSPASLHNNHHGMDFTKSHSSKWYEIDTGSWIIGCILKPLLESKKHLQ